MVASKNVTARSIETMKGPRAPDQLQVGGDPEDIAVNQATNKIYILNPGNGTVTVFDSKSSTVKVIPVGLGDSGFGCPYCIAIDFRNNKIYVANSLSDTVSVIDGNSDTVKNTIPVGEYPTFILVEPTYVYTRIGGIPAHLASSSKIYVANSNDGTVSVIDGNNDSVKNIVYTNVVFPTFILRDKFEKKTYVAGCIGVSAIGDYTDTRNYTIHVPPGFLPCTTGERRISHQSPVVMYENHSEIYVLGINNNNNSYRVDVHNGTVKHIPFTLANVYNGTLLYAFLDYRNDYPYNSPTAVQDTLFPSSTKKIYIRNDNGTVSVVGQSTGCFTHHGPCISNRKHIVVVGQHPGPIAINDYTHIVYIGYPESGTISVINGFTDRVAVGAIFNVNPSDSGIIKCNNTIYPTNTYIYVDSGTRCTAQSGKGFEFNTWTESPLTNRNSSTPIEQSAISGSPWNSFLSILGMKPNDTSATLNVNRYGIFTANFGVPHQLSGQELFGYLTGAITAVVAINGALLVLPGWRRTRIQYAHLRECIKLIDDDV